MTTLTIKTDRSDDLYLIRELARRLNLTAEIHEDENYTGIGKMKPDDIITEKEVLNDLSEAIDEIKEAIDGKRKLKTLKQLIDENRD